MAPHSVSVIDKISVRSGHKNEAGLTVEPQCNHGQYMSQGGSVREGCDRRPAGRLPGRCNVEESDNSGETEGAGSDIRIRSILGQVV